MKNYLLLLSIVGLLFFISCGGDSEESILDCGGSDLVISVSSTSNASCLENGTLVVSATGGSGNTEFSVDGTTFQTSGTFNLPAGTYTVTAMDLNGCTDEISATVGADPGTLTISAIASSTSGCKESNATIDVVANSGTSPYMYKLDDGSFQSSNQFTGVDSGDHTVTVKDDDGCEVSMTEKVLTGVSLDMEIMPIISTRCATASSCHGSGASGNRPVLETKSQIIARADRILDRAVTIGDMPLAGQTSLSQNQKDLIECWVNDGAKDN